MNAPRLPLVSAVAGVSFHQDVVNSLVEGDDVTIRHDPDNPYDANACAVTCRGELVGHLPKLLAERMVAGPERAWAGQVVQIKPGSNATGVDVRLLHALADAPAAVGTDEASTESPAAAGDAPTLVLTRSGRVVGTLVSAGHETVLVATDSGTAEYPVGLVTLGVVH